MNTDAVNAGRITSTDLQNTEAARKKENANENELLQIGITV